MSYPRSQPVSVFLTGAGLLASGLATAPALAQSADALLDKLVEKGILTTEEATELREEADKGFTTAYQVKSGLPDWVTSFRINGDLRGRAEGFFSDANDTFDDRMRYRYRARIGFTAVMMDNLEVGLRLASGDIDNAQGVTSGVDPISTNQSFQNNGAKKGIFIDMAYAKWSPLNTADWSGSLTIGKMANPYVFSDMVYDGDYTPEGIALQLGYTLNDQHALALSSAAFVLDEIGGESEDPMLYGGQIRWNATWSAKFASTLGAAVNSIHYPESLGNAAVPNINSGNTRNAAGDLVNDYYPVILDAAFTYTHEHGPFYNAAFPIVIAADYMHNPGASDENIAYSVGVTFGKAGKRGLWELSYRYKHLEADAWYEELVDSDFGAIYATAPAGGTAGYRAGTNTKGHIVSVAYSPYNSLTLQAKLFFTELIEPSPADSDSEVTRMQLDALWKF
jgi:hypothetical protein